MIKKMDTLGIPLRTYRRYVSEIHKDDKMAWLLTSRGCRHFLQSGSRLNEIGLSNNIGRDESPTPSKPASSRPVLLSRNSVLKENFVILSWGHLYQNLKPIWVVIMNK
jgi:hypothetical protein